MSANSPYNDNNSILSTVMMTGILGAGATAGYMAIKHPEKLTSVFNDARDYIMPVRHYDTSEYQNRVFKNSAERRRNEGFAKRMKNATYEARDKMRMNLIDTIERNGEIRPINIDEGKMTEAINKISSELSASGKGSAHHLKNIGIRDLNDIKDIEGNPYGPTLVKKYEEALGGKAVNFDYSNGTALSFEINGEKYTLPTAVRDPKTGAWIEKRNGSYRAHGPRTETYFKDGKIGVNITGPNEHLGSLFEAPEHLGVQKGIFDSLNTNERNRDMIIGERSYQTRDLEGSVRRSVNKTKAQIDGNNVVKDLTHSRDLKKVLANIHANGQPIVPTDAAYIEHVGKQYRMSGWSLHNTERMAGGALEGFGEQRLSISGSLFNFNPTGDNPVKISGASKMMGFELPAGIRDGSVPLTVNGKDYANLTDQGKFVMDITKKNISLALSQSQSSELTTTVAGHMAGSPSVEIMKGLGKQYTFTNSVNEVPFTRLKSRRADSSSIVRQGIRSTPVVFSPEVARTSPYLYGQNNQFINLFTVMGDPGMEESIFLRSDMKSHTKIQKDVSVKVKNVHFLDAGKVTDKHQLPSESFVDYWLEEKKENGRVKLKKYSDKTLGQLYEDSELISKVHYINAKAGTINGFDAPTGHIDSTASLENVINGKYSVTKNKLRFTQNRSQILASLEETTQAKGEYLALFGSQHERAAKIGSINWQGRSAVEFLTASEGQINDKLLKQMTAAHNGLIVPEGIVSPEMYKSVFTKIQNGETLAGKGRTAFATFLQESIAGNVGFYGREIKLEGKLKESFGKMLADPSAFDGNITDLSRNLKLQFNQRAGIGKEEMSTLIKVLGGIGENTDRDAVIGDSFSYERGAKNIEDWLHKRGSFAEKPLVMLQGFSAHEGQEAQGVGSNIWKVGLKDTPGLMPSEWIGELETRNIADTTRINTDIKLMMEGNARNIGSDLEKAGIKVLEKEGLEKILGGISQASDISDPYVIANSFLSKDLNERGFALRGDDGSLHHFGSSSTYNGGQWLDEEGKAAVQRATRVETEVLLSAQRNGGVLSKDDRFKLYNSRLEHYSAPGNGPLKTGSMHIEGAEYGINLSEANWLNNEKYKRILKQASSSAAGEQVYNMFGNVVAIDKNVYERRLFDDLDKAITLGQSENRAARDILKEQFGENNFFEQFIGDGPLESPKDASRIAREATNKMLAHGNRLKQYAFGLEQNGANQQYLSEMADFIKQNGHPMLVDRHPHVNPKSTSAAMAFVQDMGHAEGKSISLGFIQRLNLSGDNDGDKIFAMLGNGARLRDVNVREIMGSQRIAAKYMSIFKDKDLLSAGMSIDGGSKYGIPKFEELDSFLNAIKHSEAESAMNAFVTKGITGSASTRANEIRSVLLQDISKNEKLSAEAMEHLTSFAFALPGLNIEQKVISAKQAEAALTTGEQALMKVNSLVNNIGHITKEQFVKGIASVGGDLGPLHLYSAMIGAKLKQAPGWINEGSSKSIIPQLDTLMNMNFKWRRLEGEQGFKEFDSLHDLLETPKQHRQELWRQYNEVADNTTFLRDDKFIKEIGWSRHENIRGLFDETRTRGAGTQSDTVDRIWKETMDMIRNSGKDMSEAEVKSLWLNNLGRNKNFQREASYAVLGDSEIASELIAKQSAREFRYTEAIKKAIGPITPMKVGGAIGVGLVAMTAMNLLSGDGTPEDPNDLPSVSNPSFGGQRHGSMSERRVLNSPVSSNMSMGLITSANERMSDSLHNASAMYNGGRYNTVAVSSDGSSPYSSDMFKYSN